MKFSGFDDRRACRRTGTENRRFNSRFRFVIRRNLFRDGDAFRDELPFAK
ncbi:MAG TPA: hypothetical protein VIK53_03525 [Verrucomicrobiae bacterium]